MDYLRLTDVYLFERSPQRYGMCPFMQYGEVVLRGAWSKGINRL